MLQSSIGRNNESGIPISNTSNNDEFDSPRLFQGAKHACINRGFRRIPTWTDVAPQGEECDYS